MKRKTRTRVSPTPRKGKAEHNNLTTRVNLEYRDITELKNYDLTVLVGCIFSRQSGKRKFRVQDSGCFVWLGSKDKEGYGQVSVDSKTTRVHRLVYSRCVGPIPDGYVVRHTCDNPSCINPAHLLAGTQEENIADKVSRGRQARYNNHPNVKLSCRAVSQIKKELATGHRNQSLLGRKYGVSQSTIWCISKGISWRT